MIPGQTHPPLLAIRKALHFRYNLSDEILFVHLPLLIAGTVNLYFCFSLILLVRKLVRNFGNKASGSLYWTRALMTFICKYLESLTGESSGTDASSRGKTLTSALRLKPDGGSLLETEMAKNKKFNIFKLVARILRVGRKITVALADDQKITPDERDEIIALLLSEVTAYLDEVMG